MMKGDILPSYHTYTKDCLGLGVACELGVPDVCLYGALATEPVFVDSCTSYNVFPLTSHE